jgi:Zn-dependent peptidase ImmA (M78 family)
MNAWDDALVRSLADSFSVSREVIIGRLLHLKKISFDFYISKLRQYTEEYYATPHNENGPVTIPQSTNTASLLGKPYVITILTAYNQDLISPRDATQYLKGLRLKHFDDLERRCFA